MALGCGTSRAREHMARVGHYPPLLMDGGYRSGRFTMVGGVTVPERGGSSCTLETHDGHLCLAWTGTDRRLNTLWSVDGRSFGGKATLDHRSSRTESHGNNSTSVIPMPPTLAPTDAGLLLSWTGTDRRLNVLNLHGGHETHMIVNQRSSRPPALTAHKDDVVLAWTGTDRRLNIAYRNLDGSFGAPGQLAATSSRAPSVCHAGRDLMVAWTGTDRHLNLVRVSQGAPVAGPLTLQETSSHAPALCAWGDGDEVVILAWLGTDRRINLMEVTTDLHPISTTTLDVRARFRPALAVHQGDLMQAWVSSGRQLNVGRLHRM